MIAEIFYDCNGGTWSALDFNSKISFTTERGLKQSITRKIRRDLENGNLIRFFGFGSRVNVTVYCNELGFIDKPLATTTVQL